MAVEKIAEQNDDLGVGKAAKKTDVKKASTPKEENYSADAAKGLNIFQKIALFFSQVFLEVKRVVTPTRDEVLRYTGVVLVFVIVLMGFITIIDFGVGKGITALFG